MASNLDPALLSAVSQAAHEAVDAIVSSYASLPSGPVLNMTPPSAVPSLRASARPGAGPRPLGDVLREAYEIFAYRMPMDHTRAASFITAPASPLSWLGALLTAGFNAHAGSWLQSSGPSAVEDELVAWLARRAGLQPEPDGDGDGGNVIAGGIFASGGSMANLTAMAVARDTKLGRSAPAYQTGVAYASTQTHASVAKGLRVLGFAEDRIRRIDVDDHFRLDPAALRRQVEADAAAGLRPFLVVASLGTTNTGSIDDLPALASVARERDLWLHVDGAYGASVVLSNSHWHLARGLEQVDSLSWDAHKWLFQTYDTGILLVRSRELLLRTFANSNSAEYLRDALAGGPPNFWDLGPELTRPARAMKLWLTLRVLGSDAIGAMIDRGFALAETLETRLRSLPGWEIISPAQLAIVVFRYAPTGLSDTAADEANRAISREAIARNVACILTTGIGGKTVLRTVTIQPDLTEIDVTGIVDRLDEIAREVGQASRRVVAKL
ncbi:PLP-dependent transferase [Xylariaceae sp. FL0804]|nr:PLP-dependent transferase [Xylariaceae sp. FL0804]